MRKQTLYILLIVIAICGITLGAGASDFNVSFGSNGSYLSLGSSYRGQHFSIGHMNSCPGGQYVYKQQYVPGRTVTINEYRREFNATCRVTIQTPGQYYGYYDWVACGCVHYEAYYHRLSSSYHYSIPSHYSSSRTGYTPYRSSSHKSTPQRSSTYRSSPSISKSSTSRGSTPSTRGPTKSSVPSSKPSITRPPKPAMPKTVPKTAPKGSTLKSRSDILKLRSGSSKQ